MSSSPLPAATDARRFSIWNPRAWFTCERGEIPTLLWVIGLHVALVAGLLLLPIAPLSAIITAGVLLFLGGLGTTVAYHRALAHRAVTLNPVIEQILIFFAMFNGSGSPRNWVTMHRYHHQQSDKPDDISSPHYGGFWWSHLRWLWQAEQPDKDRLVKDMSSFRYRIWTSIQTAVLAGAVGLGAVWFFFIPWQDALAAMLWIGPVRLVWALHTQCSVNSICHLGAIANHGGSSRNVAWLTIAHMGQGENWHANHHRSPADPRIGHRWQLDLGWWTIRGLGLLGMARWRKPKLRVEAEAPGVEDESKAVA
jgi:stearoyl-CoA desaturase (delta-9 desaturase)